MYIRRKVFSILTDETGEERLFSVNETIIEEQREFGARKRKLNRKITRELRYQEINENKALKAAERAENLAAKGDVAGAKKATERAQKKAQESMKNAQRLDERVGTAAKTRKSIDTAEGLNLKREGKLHNTTTNIKRDLAGNQTTAVQEVVAKHDVIPGTTKKVAKRRSVFVERDPKAPSSPANPLNTTTRAQAQEARRARRLKNKNAGNVVSETVTKGYKGGVNGKPVVVQEVKKVVTPTENGAVNVVKEATTKTLPSKVNSSSKKVIDETVKTVEKSGKKLWKINPAKWSKNAKIAGGVAAGATLAAAGAYTAKKLHDKKKD
jgi:hypothetical protein